MSTTETPNAYVVVLGTSTSPLTFVGPFATNEEAQQHAAKHEAENPDVPAVVDPLLNPANC